MATARETRTPNAARSDRRRGATARHAQWWKAWVLLTSLGATVAGWMTFTRPDPPAVSAAVSQQPAPMRTDVNAGHLHVPLVRAIEPTTQSLATGRALRAMPQKPVFQAPVTRTRRS
jgi:hypothetical protein